MPIFASILSVAVPVAAIAAEVLPLLQQRLSGNSKTANASDQIRKTGMIEWIVDEQTGHVLAVNSTEKALTCSFQQEVQTDGAYGTESSAFILGSRQATAVTKDLEVYGESGNFSQVHYKPIDLVSTEEVDLTLAQYMVTLAAVTAATIILMGGKIRLTRQTENGLDQWKVECSSALTRIKFNYKDANQNEINISADLRDSESTADMRANQTHNYVVNLEPGILSTGLLYDFNVSTFAEKEVMATLMEAQPQREIIDFDELPEHVRAQSSLGR